MFNYNFAKQAGIGSRLAVPFRNALQVSRTAGKAVGDFYGKYKVPVNAAAFTGAVGALPIAAVLSGNNEQAAEEAAAPAPAVTPPPAEDPGFMAMLKNYYDQGMGYVDQGIDYIKEHPWQVGIPAAALSALGLGALYYNQTKKKKKSEDE